MGEYSRMRIICDVDKIRDAEAIVLDCDGTIIDASGSYDLAVRVVTAIIIDKLFRIEVEFGKDFEKALTRLRMTGGFNNDSDATSSLIQALSIFIPDNIDIKSDKWERLEKIDKYIRPLEKEHSYPEFIHEALEWLEYEIRSRREYFDLRKIEKLLDVKASSLGRITRLLKLRKILNYPGAFGDSLLATLFDEVFLGAEGVKVKYSMEPRYAVYEGTLKNERILIHEESIKKLIDLFPKGIALVTGRGRWETEKTLQPILKYFKMDASIFTADKGIEYEKPNPKSLIESARLLGARKIVYVGNSMEDLLMSQAANKEGLSTGFVAVSNSEVLSREFEEMRANAIIDDINELPELILITKQ